MQDIDLAYAAGYFDGEGCITFCAGAPRIAIVSADFWCIKLFSDMFGGPVSEHGAHLRFMAGCTPGHRMFRWSLSGSKVIPPLKAMYPFLRTKHHEARTVIESGVVVMSAKERLSLSNVERRITNEQKAIRAKLKNDLSALKCNGRQFDYPKDIQ